MKYAIALLAAIAAILMSVWIATGANAGIESDYFKRVANATSKGGPK